MFTLTPLALATLEALGDPSDSNIDAVWYAYRVQRCYYTMAYWRKMQFAREGFMRWAAAVGLDQLADIAVCVYCNDLDTTDDGTAVDGEYWCETCFQDNYGYCGNCGDVQSHDELRWEEDWSWCESCFDQYFTWCDECDGYVRDYSDHVAEYHEPEDGTGCCEAPNRVFRLPMGDGEPVANDERMTVESPAGTIDDAGMKAICDAIWESWPDTMPHPRRFGETWDVPVWEKRTYASNVLAEVGPIWQAKRGNFTRRLSSAWYKATGSKLPDDVVSQVGNLARAHSSGETTWRVEFTRDLNQSASAFYHDDSCWWQSEYKSRCALKSWGGIGIRSYAGDADGSWRTSSDNPTGRAWLQPLDENLEPTHDTMGAHAYVVYNGYGELSGYIAARIIAQMTGKTYRRVNLNIDRQWTNGGDNSFGVLVADAATCDDTSSVGYCYAAHDQLDAVAVRNRADGACGGECCSDGEMTA